MNKTKIKAIIKGLTKDVINDLSEGEDDRLYDVTEALEEKSYKTWTQSEMKLWLGYWINSSLFNNAKYRAHTDHHLVDWVAHYKTKLNTACKCSKKSLKSLEKKASTIDAKRMNEMDGIKLFLTSMIDLCGFPSLLWIGI